MSVSTVKLTVGQISTDMCTEHCSLFVDGISLHILLLKLRNREEPSSLCGEMVGNSCLRSDV